MKVHSDQNRAIKEVLAAITVDSPQEFTLAGRKFHVPQVNQTVGSNNGSSDPSRPFVNALSAYLYEFAYSRSLRRQLPAPEVMDLSADLGLIDAMSAANSTRERWEHGWKIEQVLHHGQISAYKGSLRRTLWPGQFLSKDGPAAMPRPQAEISIFYARESRSLQNGFYYAFGEIAEEEVNGFGLVRLYWNIKFDGAARLVGHTTSRFNRFHIPFRLKCATARSQFERTDVAVIYLAKRFFGIAAAVIPEVHSEVSDFLEDEVPLFSKKLAKGLGVAEDPGTGESFGQSRCQRLAQAVWNCYIKGQQSTEGRFREFHQLLTANGINTKYPHLNAGSSDWYELASKVNGRPSISIAETPALPRGSHQAVFIETAAAVGAKVCRDALWANGRCNWIGPLMEPLEGRWHQVHKIAGPDLYGGTSGVALSLATLFDVTGERMFKRTALGAINHALARVEDIEPSSRFGLYSGWLGISLASFKVAKLLDEEALSDSASHLIQLLKSNKPDLSNADVLAGCAGSIVGLLRVFEKYVADDELIQLAVRLGDHLIQDAVKTEKGWSWGDLHKPGSGAFGNMTGYSHGAGGIGWALLELYVRNNELRFRDAAEAAFQYERNWFDPSTGNWPDLRDPELSGGRRDQGPSFMNAWCHGAPGITLSRLRSYEILKCEICRGEAETGIETTLKNLHGNSEVSQTNYSLCHGLGGNCEALIYGSRVLGRPDLFARAEEVALSGIQNYEEQKLPWPCGGPGALESAGLMMGLAGISYYYLRMAHPETTPSVLII
jgi:hypothetical protein